MTKLLLGVNIDHVATLREARKGDSPSPLKAALIAEKAGADLITIHLREDRRHIQDEDVYLIKSTIKVPLNLEMAVTPEIIDIALDVNPYKVTIVPEKREEVTTEGGLDVLNNLESIKSAVSKFKEKHIFVSLFIDAEREQIKASKDSGAECIEIHTGTYANNTGSDRELELAKIIKGVNYAKELGLAVHAGHGLTLENVQPFTQINEIEELNIGHSIIADAVLTGLESAIADMRKCLGLV